MRAALAVAAKKGPHCRAIIAERPAHGLSIVPLHGATHLEQQELSGFVEFKNRGVPPAGLDRLKIVADELVG